MQQVSRIAAIVNPHSAGGRTAKRWPGIARRLEERVGPVTTRFTERSGHAMALAREFALAGFDLIIAVGGDGTFNEAANGLIESDEPVRRSTALAVIPAGTGGDFRRALSLTARDRTAQAIEIIAQGQPVDIDVGKARFIGHDGLPVERYFVNLLSFGMGGAVAARARNFLTAVGGRTAFLWATVRVLLSYRGRTVIVSVDNGPQASFKVTNVAVGNGPYHGGGMYPCPTARLDDGIFEVTIIQYMNMFRLLRDIRVLYNGDIFSHPKVRALRGVRIHAEGSQPTLLEVDGEPLGQLPVEITVLPRRLPVMMAPSQIARPSGQ